MRASQEMKEKINLQKKQLKKGTVEINVKLSSGKGHCVGQYHERMATAQGSGDKGTFTFNTEQNKKYKKPRRKQKRRFRITVIHIAHFIL